MTSIPEHERGRRDGIRWAVTWLALRAKAMNDPHAEQILNSAATNMGWALRHTITGEGNPEFWESGAMLKSEFESAENRRQGHHR